MNTILSCNRAPAAPRFIFSPQAVRLLVVSTIAGFVLHLGANAAAAATCAVNGAGGAQFTTIQAAVDDATCSQINVAAGTYNEHVTIARDVAITGAGATTTIVDGTNNGRVFTINSGVVSLNDLTVQHGRSPDGSGFLGGGISSSGRPGGPGGGVLNKGTLAITRLIVRENQSGKGQDAANISCPAEISCSSDGGDGGDGAGISSSGTLTVEASAFINNATGAGGAAGTFVFCDSSRVCTSLEGHPGNGGAIAFADGSGAGTIAASSFSNNSGRDGGAINQHHQAVLTISDSQFTGNSSSFAGGAVNCDSEQACTIQRSTFASNSAAGYGGGGGISFFGNGIKTLTNCTFANNSATREGGGIWAWSGPISLNFVTIVGNRSDSDNNGGGDGGGIYNRGSSLTVKNSLITGNTKGAATPQNCSGGFTDDGYNLDSAATCGFNAPTSQSNTDPLLDPAGLSDNGGPTQTIALQANSPALDKANAAGTVTADQRGLTRPYDLPSVANAAGADGSDVGAFERGPGSIQFTTATQSVSETAATVTVTVSRTGGAIGSMSVTCSTADGTAKSAAAGAGTPDYMATQAALSWADGENGSKSFTVAIANDGVSEGDESFSVGFSAPSATTFFGATTTETITIVDDEPPPPPTPTPSPTASPTPPPATSPTPTPTPAATATPTPSASPTPISTPSPSVTPLPTVTPTVTPLPTVTPSASPTPTATATPGATATPTPAAAARQLLNIATRLRVQTGENVLIGGVIVTGTEPKKVLIRAIGPSLSSAFDGALSDTKLDLYEGDTLLASNENWKDTQQAEIEATTIPPNDELESAIVYTLNPGVYTAIMSGENGATGIGVIEVYDLDQAALSKLANIATRGFVQTGENIMIGGLIVGGNGADAARILIRAIGPSLLAAGISDALRDPTLELVDADGNVVRANDNWQDEQQAEIEATTVPPSDPAEAAIVVTLGSGNYTAVVRGKNGGIGVGLVEVYNVQ